MAPSVMAITTAMSWFFSMKFFSTNNVLQTVGPASTMALTMSAASSEATGVMVLPSQSLQLVD